MAAAVTKTFDLEGVAEDIESVIFDISPMDTWALSTLKRKSASNTTHQWLTDSLAAASASNAQIEGDDASFTTATTAVLFSNQTQIARKTVEVSRTADSVKKYGRAESFAYELAKKSKEIKRDVESTILSSQASSAGGPGTARVSAGIGSMISGNRVIAGSATAATVPGYTAGQWVAAADGTAAGQTALTETHLQTALENAWTDGGDPSVVLCGPFQKAKMATFAGASAYSGFYNPQAKAAQGAVVGAVDVYVSSFGSHKIQLSRWMPTNKVYCIDPEYASVAFLDTFKFSKLAKTGDGEKGMIVCEFTVVADNPDAHAQIISLTTA